MKDIFREGEYVYKASIGQDSHAFEKTPGKALILGGVDFTKEADPSTPGLSANSDGDVIFHAVTNAISGITCINILGKVADDMCRSGITDSKEYLKRALEDLAVLGYEICHLSVSVECLRPKISPLADKIRQNLSEILNIPPDSVGITATSGEGLTAFGKGKGVSVLCILTVRKKAATE